MSRCQKLSGFAALVCGRHPNTSQSLQQSVSCLQASTSISRNLARSSELLDCPVAMVLQSGDYRLPFDQGFPNYSWDHKGMISQGIFLSEVSAPFSASSGNKTRAKPGMDKKSFSKNSVVEVIPPYRVTA